MSARHSSAGGGRKILIVEDSASVRKTLRAVLKHCGYVVIEAADGNEALSQTVLHRPDLIVLDVILPSQSGLDVCAKLKSHDEFKDIPVLLFTGVAEKMGKPESHWLEQSFADEFLAKPAKASELLKRVEGLMAKKRKKDGGTTSGGAR